MEQYGSEIKKVFEAVEGSEQGLTSEEAQRRLAKNGRNALKEEE